ncbi:OrdA protein [Pholiota molesta]|nr:OrdA protein [Pholiota molesta]
MTALDVAAAGATVYFLWRLLESRKSSSHYLPPGPKGLPLIGVQSLDMPPTEEWLTFAEWGRKWGGILSVSILGQPMIIVNSARIMDELDKKGAIYSDRPLVGYDQTLVLIEYGSRFRTYRKHFSRYLGTPKARKFLKRTLAKPDHVMDHLRKLSGGVILRLTYGYEVQEGEDPFVTLIEGANENFNAATVPGAFPVDFFPALKNLPEWLPGMGFMKTARNWAKIPRAWTTLYAAGTAVPSFVSTCLEDEANMSADDLRDLKFTLALSGADTTAASEYAFYLAMTLFPDVQKKAQAEIDAVIGNGRLPSLSDLPQLPYVQAVVTEVLRWNSVAPTGVPHRPIEDGFIGGYFIPKGSLILVNLWNMLHDPETYPEPFEFRPERHIATPEKEAELDPRKICFGFGRRICPGMYLAEASVFCCVAMSLAVFNVEKAVENGVPITPVHGNTSGIISYPKPFKCAIALISEEIL